MDKKYDDAVDRLFLRETAYFTIMSLVNMHVSLYTAKNEFEKLRVKIFKDIYMSNIDIVFKFAESPIEKIFLNALLLQNLLSCSYPIIYTPPLHRVNHELSCYRSVFEDVMNLWQNFQKTKGEDDIDKFIQSVFESPIPEESKNVICQFILYEHLLKHCNVFHFSLQCFFDDIRVNGKYIRPDIFIWVPSKPEFKFIVECDGYKYHSDKQSFTNDKERERKLKSMGFQVFRFSGHEINRDPVGKAKELNDYLATLQFEMFREEILEDYSLFDTKPS